jgi:peroxiredoxin
MITLKHTVAAISMFTMVASAMAQETKKAPDFSVQDEDGKMHSLADHKGKVIVMEFTNPGSPVAGQSGCPFVIPRYEKKIMQNLAEKVTDSGGVYLAVNSAYYNTAADSKAIEDKYGVTHPTLIDTSGTIARAYDAKTTPHMFVINKEGNIIYDGALNDNASPDVEKDADATNYVMLAVEAANKGEMPRTTKTKPYGCGVKIKD